MGWERINSALAQPAVKHFMEPSLETIVKIQKSSEIDRSSRKCSYLRISGL